MFDHYVATPIIEVAGDGKTAQVQNLILPDMKRRLMKMVGEKHIGPGEVTVQNLSRRRTDTGESGI